MSAFHWHKKSKLAALKLADGYTEKEAAAAAGVTDRTIRRWKADITFSDEVDRLTLTTGLAVESEQIKLIKRLIQRKRGKDGELDSARDVSDLMRLMREVTTGRAGAYIEINGYEDMIKKVYGSDQGGQDG